MPLLPRVTLLSFALFAGAIQAGSAAAAPQTFTVNTTADAPDITPGDGACATAGGTCSLRAGVQESDATADADTVVLPAGEYHLSLGDLDVSNPLTIQGAAAGTTSIDPDDTSRAISVTAGAPLTLRDLTLEDGTAAAGGGIEASGSLVLEGVVVRNNVAGGPGGGIHLAPGGSLTMTATTIAGNQAGTDGGGLALDPSVTVSISRSTISGNESSGAGGGLSGGATGTITLTNSTVSGNRADTDGGGMASSGTTTLTASTVASNRADDDASGTGNGGGLVHVAGSLTLRASIVAGNADASAGAEAPDCAGAVGSAGSNLVGTTLGCAYAAAATDRVNVPPGLGGLGNNGGPTQTHALIAGSPALDAVSGPAESVDQRGVPRPQGAAADIGAYELALCFGTPATLIGFAAGTLTGTASADVIFGSPAADVVDGGGGDDKICANGGEDELTGGSGNDMIDGGPDPDTLVEAISGLMLLDDESMLELDFDDEKEYQDSISSIERARLTGNSQANLIDAISFHGPVTASGGDGNDAIGGGIGNDKLDGGPGRDLVGAIANANFTLTDTAMTGAGTDSLLSFESAFMAAGDGANRLDASAFGGSVFLSGGRGRDALLGTRFDDTLEGGGGRDRLFGTAGRDRLYGDSGRDRLLGQTGDDRLDGGPGRDRMNGGPGRKDRCYGRRGTDRFRSCERIAKGSVSLFSLAADAPSARPEWAARALGGGATAWLRDVMV